ncbi:PEP-CTERM sorting domain-containing protein [Ideonella sp. A 288]|uniref:PEP-CTERM sorting domain-containing protein n=1 Tax=Ideonella sp. A 288 TaxID=1962181 RepID=UPI000B4B2C7E|nr:PEP-CTERM sorting domain-containing protein [Ideonella sp. A 288]
MSLLRRLLVVAAASAALVPQFARAEYVTMDFEGDALVDDVVNPDHRIGSFYAKSFGITFGNAAGVDNSSVFEETDTDAVPPPPNGSHRVLTGFDKRCETDNCAGEPISIEFSSSTGLTGLRLTHLLNPGTLTISYVGLNPLLQQDSVSIVCPAGGPVCDWDTSEFDFKFVAFRVSITGADSSYVIDDLSVNRFSGNTIPEPASFALAGMALLGMAASRRRRTSR